MTGSPFDHLASFRKSNVHVLPLFDFLGSPFAIAGSALSSLSKRYKPSWVAFMTSNAPASTAKLESKVVKSEGAINLSVSLGSFFPASVPLHPAKNITKPNT